MHSVLVVEDEAVIALDLACSLEALGYRVLGPVASAAEARRIAARDNPDLLLMDITIRGLPDGIEAAREITRDMPAKVVFLTARTDEATRRRAASVNPLGFLQKPWTVWQMQRLLSEVFA